jgi:hypothetical protein
MHCLIENHKSEMERVTKNLMKNDVKVRNSPPRFKNRRKHNSGGHNKNANKVHKEVKFQTVAASKVATPEIGSSNKGTMVHILQRSPNRSPTRGLTTSPKPEVSCPSPPTLVAPSNSNGPSFDNNTANNDQLLIDGKSYAGSRFHTPPRPDLLPKPPTHWISCNMAMAQSAPHPGGFNINMHLKGLLKVQA